MLIGCLDWLRRTRASSRNPLSVNASKVLPQPRHHGCRSTLQSAYVPKPGDFRRLRSNVRDRRRLYESKDPAGPSPQGFAHKVVTKPDSVAALFARTNIRELQRTLAFLGSLHEALWQLFFNGRRPSLRPRRYLVRRMRDLPSPAWKRRAVQERIGARRGVLDASHTCRPTTRCSGRAASGAPLNANVGRLSYETSRW